MKIKYLGTAAAECIPAVFCECEVCKRAKERGGKEIRRRHGYLIDDDTMVDFGPDAVWQSFEFGIDLTKLKRIIFTHPHADHLNAMDLAWRHDGYSIVNHDITIFGSFHLFNVIARITAANLVTYDIRKELKLNIIEMGMFEEKSDGDVSVKMLRANHAPGIGAQLPIIRRNGKSFLVAHDTGMFGDDTWEALKGEKLDGVSLECTCAFQYPDLPGGHMGIHNTVQTRDRLLEMGCITEKTPVVVTHFSHNGQANHDRLCEYFEPKGIQVAYDGKELEI